VQSINVLSFTSLRRVGVKLWESEHLIKECEIGVVNKEMQYIVQIRKETINPKSSINK